MRILVCGSRKFNDKDFLYSMLDLYLEHYGPFKCLVEGGATGADALAKEWAKDMDIPVEEYPALWDKYGEAAGPIRNHKMLVEGEVDIVFAFPGGVGTKNLIKTAKELGIRVIEF